ncbi:hypothetical protein CC79DRAFT_1362797 [Sarocladium strictum]
MLNRGGPLSKLVSGTIGLAKEYKADSKERKANAQSQSALQQSTPTSNERNYDSDSSDDYDYLLDLDEAQLQVSGTIRTTQDVSSGSQSFDIDNAAQAFLQQHPLTGNENFSFSTFVLLPQRRPKSQAKGFVRAYAPELSRCGIDQTAWLQFLDNFEKSISKNAVFHVLNAGIFVASNAAAVTASISPAMHMASMAIHVSVEAARRGYVNHQQNKFLDIMNKEYFMPRGLYCMVVKYEPSSPDVIEDVNIEQNVCQSIGSRQDQSRWKGAFSNSAMKIDGEMEMPDPAPLIFPDLDAMSDSPASTNAWKNFNRVMQDYKDRRAAAKFEGEHPNNSKMPSAPRKEFASEYGDPNSETNSGGFISLMSKGTKTSLGRSGGLPDKIAERRDARKTKRKEKKSKRPMSKMLKADALYLMVTNLPSQEMIDKVAAPTQASAAYN